MKLILALLLLLIPVSANAQNNFPSAGRGTEVTSTVNKTLAPLNSGQTFTGTWESVSASDVMVSCQSDKSGVLYFDFSNDGGDNYSTFPAAGFTVAASTQEFHTAVKGPRSFRIRFSNTSGENQTYLRCYTYYGTYRQPSNPMNNLIRSDADATVTKAVISGVGNTTASVTDHGALQVTPPREAKSAFGSALVESLSNEIALGFAYNINPDLVDVRENSIGTVTQANAMAVVSSGASANSAATMLSKDYIRYVPGTGIRARFTGLFTTGVANSTQIIGIGDESNAIGVGYNGTSFGILHRRNGSPEIRVLTVGTKSSTAENITITIDGVSTGDVIPVTNGADATVTANEIAAYDYSDIGKGWKAYAAGNTVIFVSWDAAVHTGSYSLSGSTTAVGTFAQQVVGVAPTETWIPQASWNGDDIFDGNGVTGVTIDPTKGNVYQISYQWLGYGVISIGVEDPDDGEYHTVHTIEYANANTTPSLSNPSLPLMVYAGNTSNTSAIVVKTASMGAFKDGHSEAIGRRKSVSATKTVSGSSEVPILTIRNKLHFQSKKNNTKTKIEFLSGAVEHTKPVRINFYRNATLVGASFTDISATSSTIFKDTSATSFSGGTEIFSMALGKTGNQTIDLSDDIFAGMLRPGEQVTATISPQSGTGAEGSVSFNIIEMF